MQAHRTHRSKPAAFSVAAAFVLAVWTVAFAGAREVPPEPGATTAPSVSSASPPDFVLPRIAGPITVDGALDEEAWKSALVVDRFYEFAPGESAQPPVQTVGLLAYDSEFLYVGARCADPELAKLRAPYVDRDRVSDQDFVQIDVDARDEARWSMIFRVNPRGVQADGVFDETVGEDDFSPDYHWDAAARVGPDGWTAEMKIPLSTLRYRGEEPQAWRITFYRLYPRDFRYSIASAPIPRNYNCWLCHAVRYGGIEGLPHRGGIVAAPFVTGGASEAGPGGRSRQSLDAGGDLKWLPQPNLAVDLTWNPDFSQVEADAPQIAVNNRFALFYPEKRPFFLEGLDLWSSPLQVVHTRTITEPTWGARLTGRPGNGAYTLLAVGDRGGGSLILPGPDGSSFAPQPRDARVLLGRWRQTVGHATIGGLATVREAGNGYRNRVGGVDVQWYPTAADRWIGQLLWSGTRDPGQPAADDHAAFLRWERTQEHLGWTLQLDELGRDFRADSGFVPQTGIRHAQGYLTYNFYPRGFFRHVWPRFYYDVQREPGGAVVTEDSAVGIGVDGRFRAVLDWYARERARGADGRLLDQSYWKLSSRVLVGRRLPLVQLTARRGDDIDIAGSRLGSGSTVSVLAQLSLSDRLQAELSGTRRQLDVPEGGQEVRLFTATVSRARFLYTFTARSFARLVGEWNAVDRPASDDRSFGGSALYGYRVNWQSILYVGYGNSPAELDGERRQELFVKVAYAFRP